MATPLDIGLLSNFKIIFPFLLSVFVIYGILSYKKVFGDNKTLHLLIALFVGFFILFSATVREIISTMAPWFILLFIFIFFGLIVFMSFGATETDIMDVVSNEKYRYIIWWFVALSVIIAIGSVTSVTFKEGKPLGVNETTEGRTTTASESGTSAFWNILFHPKVLGLTVIFLVALFTVSRLSASS
jgi:hypothetical protein